MRAEAWVEIQPVRSEWEPDRIWKVKIGRLMKRRPKDLRPDTLLVKVSFEVPADAFGRTVRVTL